MTRVLVLNGPEPRPPRRREPEVYGTATYADLVAACEDAARELGLEVEVRQTDDEAELVGWLHEAADAGTPVVLNPAAFTHYSYALRDACAAAHRPAGRGAPDQPRGPGGVPAHLGGGRRWRPAPSPASASTPTGWRCVPSPIWRHRGPVRTVR